MPKLKQGTILPTPEEDRAITRAALSDPDAAPLTDAEWEQVKPTVRRGRGRPAGSGHKVPTNIRLDVDVVDAFKATGDGWQTRMNDALRDWARSHGMIGR